MLTWLLSFRLRVLFRLAFLLLACATVLLALYLLREEKALSYRSYRDGVDKTAEQIAGKLRHPAGQLALLNPGASSTGGAALHPLLLPFAAIDFDDQNKAQQAVEMAGCQVQYGEDGALCVAVGNNPWAGGFIYVVGRFHSEKLLAHPRGEARLDGAHRLRVAVSLRGQQYRWLAPFETLDDGDERHGRLTGFVERGEDYSKSRPVRDFRGWLWQDRHCVLSDAGKPAVREPCQHRSFFSVRLPITALHDDLLSGASPVWPPADLDRIEVAVQMLAPGDGPALLDSGRAGAVPPFSLADLRPLLLPGETLSIRKLGGAAELIRIVGNSDGEDPAWRWVQAIVRRLVVDGFDQPIVHSQQIATALGRYEFTLTGDVRGVNRRLAAVATRVSWFVGAMLLAIFIAWLVIEAG
ncbi:hypothetical protein, partial [Chitinimonas sp.]|uniref:hypothetical protein n=1 Tax=Chitinimonas sp. TaxID=1934313 RepID=UPI0035B32723